MPSLAGEAVAASKETHDDDQELSSKKTAIRRGFF